MGLEPFFLVGFGNQAGYNEFKLVALFVPPLRYIPSSRLVSSLDLRDNPCHCSSSYFLSSPPTITFSLDLSHRGHPVIVFPPGSPFPPLPSPSFSHPHLKNVMCPPFSQLHDRDLNTPSLDSPDCQPTQPTSPHSSFARLIVRIGSSRSSLSFQHAPHSTLHIQCRHTHTHLTSPGHLDPLHWYWYPQV